MLFFNRFLLLLLLGAKLSFRFSLQSRSSCCCCCCCCLEALLVYLQFRLVLSLTVCHAAPHLNFLNLKGKKGAQVRKTENIERERKKKVSRRPPSINESDWLTNSAVCCASREQWTQISLVFFFFFFLSLHSVQSVVRVLLQLLIFLFSSF